MSSANFMLLPINRSGYSNTEFTPFTCFFKLCRLHILSLSMYVDYVGLAKLKGHIVK